MNADRRRWRKSWNERRIAPSRSIFPFLFSLFLSAFICVHPWLTPVSAEEQAPGITWRSFDDGVAEAVATERVLVVYFTADWCGWCRKMESATFADPRVTGIAPRLAWAKVDIDEQPEIAARFGVRGVPTAVFLNARGEVLAGRSGYTPPDPFLELLTQNQEKANAPGAAREQRAEDAALRDAVLTAETDEALAEAVTQALALLAKDGRRQRQALAQAVASVGPRAWPVLVDGLASDQLAVRAAAADLLRSTSPSTPAFDPFADAEVRARAVADWRAWLAQAAAEPVAQPAVDSSGSSAP